MTTERKITIGGSNYAVRFDDIAAVPPDMKMLLAMFDEVERLRADAPPGWKRTPYGWAQSMDAVAAEEATRTFLQRVSEWSAVYFFDDGFPKSVLKDDAKRMHAKAVAP